MRCVIASLPRTLKCSDLQLQHLTTNSKSKMPSAEKSVHFVAGPYGVGAVDLMLDPADCAGELAPKGLFARVFYPTDNTYAAPFVHRQPWLPRAEYANWSMYGRVWQYAARRKHTGAGVSLAWRAPLARCGFYNVCVFSHGYMGARFTSQSVCAAWAAHGYIVFAVEHRDSSAIYTYALTRNGGETETTIDHRKVDIKADFENETSVDLPIMAAYRARECAACLRVADALNAGVTTKPYSLIDRDFDWAQFQGRIRTQDAVIVGHSMGGLTALSAPAFTDRFKGILIDYDKIKSTNPVAICLDAVVWPAFANNEEIITKVKSSKTACILIWCSSSLSRHWSKRKDKDRRRQLLAAANQNFDIVFKNTAHECFTDPSHWMRGCLWRHLVYGTMPAATCDQLLIDLSLSYMELARTHTHADIKTNRLWPPQSIADKYPNKFQVNQQVL